ncbi:MAG: ParA family protein, partial [Gammaproteobacteria bacterium]|nr:ParA family protein [Gammaproteobacteria bacterium]
MAIKVCVVSTKGGVGKTTSCVNLAGYLADQLGQRVLLIDADVQPTLSSYHHQYDYVAANGLSHLVHARVDDIVSRVSGFDDRLHIVRSDDPEGQLQNWILHTPDGRVRLRHILRNSAALDASYDIILIDTQGAVGPLQDAAVLAADFLVSPIPAELLSAREFARGTLGMLERLAPMSYMGAPVGPLMGLLYRMDRTRDAAGVAQALRQQTFSQSRGQIQILNTVVPHAVAYRDAATAGQPVHRISPRQGDVMAA